MIDGKSGDKTIAHAPESLEQVDFETLGPAPRPSFSQSTSVRQEPLRIIQETAIRKPPTARSTPKAKGTTPVNVPTPAPASASSIFSMEGLAALRCFICASPSVENLLPLRHQPKWGLGACKHPETYGTWEAHRECALLIDETIVYDIPGRIRGQVEFVRAIDPDRFKLVRLSFIYCLWLLNLLIEMRGLYPYGFQNSRREN